VNVLASCAAPVFKSMRLRNPLSTLLPRRKPGDLDTQIRPPRRAYLDELVFLGRYPVSATKKRKSVVFPSVMSRHSSPHPACYSVSTMPFCRRRYLLLSVQGMHLQTGTHTRRTRVACPDAATVRCSFILSLNDRRDARHRHQGVLTRAGYVLPYI